MRYQGVKRSDRVGEAIIRVLAQAIQHRVKDPRIEGVTVTGVKVTDDLRQTRVFYALSHASGEQQVPPERVRKAQQGLEKAAGFLKRQLADEIDLRVIPELLFTFDASLDRGARIESLIDQLHHSGKSDDHVE